MNQFGISNLIWTSLATCLYQLKSSFSIQRISVSVILASFPPVMLGIAIIASQSGRGSGALDFIVFQITLLVSIVCLLSLLLWATPNVYSELEGKSWIFVASRPRGRLSCFFGKFLASFLSGFAISMIALTACIALANQLVGMRAPLQTWLSMTGIYFFACWTYSAIFSMIGTITVKRAMVISAGFIILWEAILASFPSVISKLTVRYHLQSLGFEWIGWFIPEDVVPKEIYTDFYGTPYIPFHIFSLFLISVLCLGVGCFVITYRQYITADES